MEIIPASMQPQRDAEMERMFLLSSTSLNGGGMDSCCNGLFLSVDFYFFFAAEEKWNSIVPPRR